MSVRIGMRAFLLALGLVLIAASYELSRLALRDGLVREAHVIAQTRVQSLQSILAVQRAVAGILADDGRAKAALKTNDPQLAHEVSRKLEYLHKETASTIIYLLNHTGMTISASNWRGPISFVGGDYAFRDYFKDAIAHGSGLEYGMGKDSFRPGLYLSHDIRDQDELLGVIVVKMDFEMMEATWARSQDLTYVQDAQGDVVLTSDPKMRFHPSPKINRDPAAWITVQERVPGTQNWQLILQTTAAPSVRGGALAALLMAGAQLLGYGLWRRRNRKLQYQRDLEYAVKDRTQALSAEAEERRTAEENLAQMQGELVQANKLATLGQVTAGLAHEVNQPLATIRLLADNARDLMASNSQMVLKNLDQIIGMTDRIDRITTQLRGFARKATGDLRAVSVREVLEASILLTASRRRGRGATLNIIGNDPKLMVKAEAVRLEQVLVNLIQNAQEALHETPNPRITITVQADHSHITFLVSDNGPGIAPEMEGQVFMPFATSKSEGLGLGLVIARQISRDLGGDLTLKAHRPNPGVTFILRLNRA